MKQFPESWRVEPASSVCREIVDCLNKTAPTVERDTGLKMIRTTNVKSGRVDLEDVRFVEESIFLKWTRRLLPRRNDIVLTREAPLGEVGLLRSDDKVMLGQRTMVYRADEKQLDQIFLYYSLLGPILQAQIKTLGSGSTVEHMRVPDAEALEIPVPPREAQRRIAGLLCAYDELIENNRRRIALLERMAEQLYREWFVRFRFPGYRQAKFEKGVPKGWGVKPSSELIEVMSGGTPKTDVAAYWSGDIPFFTPKDASENFYVLDTEKKVSPSGLEACNSKLYPKDTIFITARGTVGKLVLAHRDMVMNQSCYALAPKNTDVPFFHFLALKAAVSTIKGVSNSGVFDNIVVDTFKVVPVRLPPDDLVRSFNKLMAPIFEQIGSLLSANVVLAQTRDLLLPRLISGKLRVDDLDIQFPPSMQAERA